MANKKNQSKGKDPVGWKFPGPKLFENLFLYFTFIFVAIFAHPTLTYEFSTSKYFFLIIFMTILICAFLLRRIATKQLSFYVSWAHVGWFVFGIAAVLSTFTVLSENPRYYPFSLEIGLYTFLTVFMVLYFSNFFKTKREITFFLSAVLVAGLLVSIEALMNFYTGDSFFLGSYGKGGKLNMKATIGNPNFVSDFLGSLLPIAVYFSLSYDFGWKIRQKKITPLFATSIFSIKVLGLVSFVLFYLVVLLAGTRAVFLSLIVGFAMFFVFRFYYYVVSRKREREDNFVAIGAVSPSFARTLKWTNRLMIGLLILVAIGLPTILSMPNNPISPGTNVASRTASIFDDRGFQVTGGKHRLFAWLASVYQWKDNPIIGSGIGTYMLDAVTYMGEAVQDHPEYVDAWSNFKRTHNDYFQVLGEIGLLGIVSVLVTLVLMGWMFFRLLRMQENPDDALLLMFLAVGFIEILGHSFTEFPLHLLPNQLWAITMGGLGFGSYFNKKGFLAFRLKPKALWVWLLLAGIIALGIVAGNLKYNSMMAESFFKQGNGFYSTLSQLQPYEDEAAKNESMIRGKMEELANRTGEYAVFDQQTYLQQRRASAPKNLSESEMNVLELRWLQDLSKAYTQELERLQGYLDQLEQQKQQIQNEGFRIYNRALDNFSSSLESADYYGKSLFYLALMMVRSERKDLLLQETQGQTPVLQMMQQVFVEDRPDTRFIEPSLRDLPLAADVATFQKLGATDAQLESMWKGTLIALWIQVKMYQDALDYFETSFLCFNEKNSYRIAGTFSNQLMVILEHLTNAYLDLAKRYPQWEKQFIELATQHRVQEAQAFENFQKWYDTAIFILPANWQSFPDWEDIYKEYIEKLISSRSINEVYPKIKEVAEKRVWAAEAMHNVQQQGVPDDIAAVYAHLAQFFLEKEMYQESLMVLRDGISLLTPSYEWNRADLENNPYLKESERKRMESYVSAFQELLAKHEQFLEQITNLYEYSWRNGTFDEKWLEDWKNNVMTGEKWEDASYEKIMELVQSQHFHVSP
ncbi:MAG TPA: O-antigen ligase family protein [Thermotogota bacterium]|nr:O-antigen ligase family protein [Thermotogota bacterium]HRW91688.1 O-antigen ligase family protein [Thermotogota bacterium]